jgi:glycosyltransferase involved in cell wall biosynthesis
VSSQPGRIRVLFMIDHAGTPGGAERFVAGLAAHMPPDRVQAYVCSTRHGDPDAAAELEAAGVPHLNLGRRSKWHVHRLLTLVRLIRRERFDVIHAHKFGSNLWGCLIGRVCRVPVVIAHEHNWSYSGNRLRVWIDRRVIGRLATRIVAVSETSRRQMVELERIAAAKTIVMPTGYVPHRGLHNGDIRSELGLAGDVPVIAVAAGFRPEKALEVMLDAHARVRDRVSNAQLVIAGDGPLRGELEQQSERLGTTQSVHFLGVRRDVDSILRSATVGAMSSDWEGMPLFVFECMAARIPLVATAVGGLTEIVQDGSNGLLVPPRDPEALGSALTTVLSDPVLAGRLAETASKRLREYEIDYVAARFADLYGELLTEARRR